MIPMTDIDLVTYADQTGRDLRLVIFGCRIKTLRERKKLSIREASAEMGVDKNTLMKMERGDSVRNDSREKVCRFYGMIPFDPVKREIAVEYGKHYTLHLPQKSVWYMVRPNYEMFTAETNDAIQDPRERLRLGRIGLVARFYCSMQLRMPRGRLAASQVELYQPTEIEEFGVGEAMLYVTRGAAKVTVGDESFVVQEGNAAVWDNTVSNCIEPAEPVGVMGYPPTMLFIDSA